MNKRVEHWDGVYRQKGAGELSWYQDLPAPSLRAIDLCANRNSSVIDIGAGLSGLTEALLNRGQADLTVLDISKQALTVARAGLKGRGDNVAWIVADITKWRPSRTYDIWHDRAVFHFLTEATDRKAYLKALDAALAPGGYVILATFSPDGPDKCSGLPICKYAPEDLERALGHGFILRHHWRELHETPFGGGQDFTWTVFQKV